MRVASVEFQRNESIDPDNRGSHASFRQSQLSECHNWRKGFKWRHCGDTSELKDSKPGNMCVSKFWGI
jgi:hypothetical protein